MIIDKKWEGRFDKKFWWKHHQDDPSNKFSTSECEEIKAFIRKELKRNTLETLDSCIGEEKEIGNEDYCKTCDQHFAGAVCGCIGYNEKRDEIILIKNNLEE